MDKNTFEAALDRWGSDLSGWPAADRQAAEALLARSNDVRLILETQRRIDAGLSALSERDISAHVQQQIVTRIQARVQAAVAARDADAVRTAPADDESWFWSWLTHSVWRPALLAGLPLILGFALGIGLTDLSERELADQVSTLALSDIYQEIDNAQQ
jgi:uncharacterized membrane protein